MEHDLEETFKEMPMGQWEEAGLLGRGKIFWEKNIPSASRKARGDGEAGRAISPA